MPADTPTNAELRNLCEDATDGPWVYDSESACASIWSKCTPSGYGRPGRKVAEAVGDDAETDPNAEFICAARTALPRLLDDNDRLTAAVAELEDMVAQTESERNELCRTIHSLRAALKAATGKDAP